MKIPSKEELERFLSTECDGYCLDIKMDAWRCADKLHDYLMEYYFEQESQDENPK